MNISKTLANKKNQAQYLMGYIDYTGHSGEIIANDGILPLLISPQELEDYNAALESVKSAVIYNTQMLLLDAHVDSIDNMHNAIDTFSDAAQELAKLDAVVSIAEQANTIEQKVEVQNFVKTNDVEITQQEVDNYNNSLTEVVSYAQQAAGFLQASMNTDITTTADAQFESFNTNTATVSASYSAVNDQLLLAWDNGSNTLSFTDYFSANFISQSELLGMGQSIYDGPQ